MEFLKEFAIDDMTLEKIKENNEESVIFNFLCFEDNAKKIITYLNEIGITVIADLLTNRLELFTLDVEKVKEHINNYNVEVLVQLINEDINTLNNI